MKTYATQATIASFGQKIAISGGATSLIGNLTANDLATMCGAIAGLGGLFVQIMFSRLRWRTERREKQQQAELSAQETRRKEELHALEKQRQQLEIQRLRKEVSDD